MLCLQVWAYDGSMCFVWHLICSDRSLAAAKTQCTWFVNDSMRFDLRDGVQRMQCHVNCYESGSHSLKLHITHGLHFPSCTALTHSRPPLHQSHSCHHSLINSDCLTTPAPHSLTHIKAAHKHSPIAKSCFPLVTFLSVLLFILLSLCFTPDCLTLDLWTCACDPRLLPGIVYVSALPLIFLFLPADPACLILPIKYCCTWIPCLWPVFTEDFAIQGSSNLSNHHFVGMDTRILFALKQGPRSLENHIREFLACAHYSDLPDIILIEIFCDGINQPLQSQLRREGPRSSLSSFLDFALTVGSPFTAPIRL